MINTVLVEEAKKLIKKEKSPVVVRAQSNVFNRKVLEFGGFDVLVSVEARPEIQKDSLRQLDSGLNHVLANIAAKNNVSFGFDVNDISRLNNIDKSQRLARIRQIILFCRKANARLAVLNAGDSKDAQHFLLSLGASSKQAKDALIL